MGKFGIRCKDLKNDYITLLSKFMGEGKLRVAANISGITANKVKGVGTCPLTGTGATNTVTYTGTTDMQENSGAAFFAVS